jgi:hypothetical protein
MNKQADMLFRFIQRLTPNNPKATVKVFIYDGSVDYIGDMDIESKDQDMYIKIPSPLDQFIEKIVDDNLDKVYEKQQSDDTGFFVVTLTIIPDERKFIIDADAQYYDTQGSETEYDLEDEKPEWFEIVGEYFDSIGNVKSVYATYEGGGDNGYINSKAETNNGNEVELTDDIEKILYRMLLNNYSGWEINEGSQGSFYITRETVIIEHEWNVEKTRDMYLDIQIKV